MVVADPENGSKFENVETENYALKIFQTSLNLLAHILIGIVVGITIMFAFRNGLPLSISNLHILLCVIGYQLLMAEGILSLCAHNSWTAGLRVVDKRRAHAILLIVGSVLAIVGSLIKSADKNVNFNTLHGKFALVAMVFTTVCLVNGLTSLYAYELRKCIPGSFSKIPHIVFGVVAFVMSLISLCYGYNYNSFKRWSSPDGPPFGFAYAVMGMSAAFTFIIIVNPMITAFNKTVRVIK
ncbi:uncharacterized protein LOC112055579 [Bicyclus anynana]|uniref:ascorbate ferrireductase (transmembrane) n=1 Tax=Bicyclus anynana TaxID=110368 RepID=A0A6J1P144_BICAN|nr:uncharacterized protein LOC112055579 [Bicyclus anynana]